MCYRGEFDPPERLSDGAAAHLCGPPWQDWPRDPPLRNIVRRQHFSSVPPLTRGCVLIGPLDLEWTLCIIAMAFVIEVREVKGANGVGVHARTLQPSQFSNIWGVKQAASEGEDSSCLHACVFVGDSWTCLIIIPLKSGHIFPYSTYC